MIDFEAHAADSAARQEADDFVLANFSFISAYTDVLRAVLCRDASVDILVLLESDCHPDANVVLSVADLADIGVDLSFLGDPSQLARPKAEVVDTANVMSGAADIKTHVIASVAGAE